MTCAVDKWQALTAMSEQNPAYRGSAFVFPLVFLALLDILVLLVILEPLVLLVG